jgi:hypothetical protein
MRSSEHRERKGLRFTVVQEPWLHRLPIHHVRLNVVLLGMVHDWKVRRHPWRGMLLATPMNGITMVIVPLSWLVTTCAWTK